MFESNTVTGNVFHSFIFQVRVEMKSELEEFRNRMKVMESGQYLKQVDATKESEDILDADESRDPRLMEAIAKMNKLDALLKKKIKREKEVKRDRIMFERRFFTLPITFKFANQN